MLYFPLVICLLALVAALINAGVGALESIRRRGVLYAEITALVATVLFLSAVAVNAFKNPLLDPSNPNLPPLLALVLSAAAAAGMVWFGSRRRPGDVAECSTPRTPPGAVAWKMSLLVAAAWLFHAVTTPPLLVEFGSGLEPVPGHHAVTDRGRMFPVYQCQLAQPTTSSEAEKALQQYGELLIRQALPDAATNCYGWVFAQGRYLLDGTTVAAILADNGYQQVETPRAGDVIVYRNESHLITHVGLVRCRFDDGLILIESKWSLGERYLHRPEDQAFARSFEYYRSPRPSHAVSIL